MRPTTLTTPTTSAAAVRSDYAHPEVLVTMQWVAEHLNDPGVRIVEADKDPPLYEIGHLLNAVKLGLAVTLLAVIVSLLVAGCGEQAPSATSLLQEAQVHFNAAQTFQFSYLVEEAQHLTRSETLYITRADGDFERPDKLSATVDVLTPSGTLTGVKLLSVGGQGWLANPHTGQYEHSDEAVTLARFFERQIGVGALLTQMKQPTPTQSNKDIWVTSGTVSADTLSGILPQLVGHTDPVDLHVDISQTDHQLVGLNLTGALFPSETSPYSHIISLERFGQPVSIQPPAGS